MLTALIVLAVLAVLFVAAAAATRDGDILLDAPPDAADLALPAGALQPEDVAEVRFGMAVRGYRMAEVDVVLERLAAELTARDRRVAQLEQALVDVLEPAVAQAEADVRAAASGGTATVAVSEREMHAPVVDLAQEPAEASVAAPTVPTVPAVSMAPAVPMAPTMAPPAEPQVRAAYASPTDFSFPELSAPEPAAPDAAPAQDLQADGAADPQVPGVSMPEAAPLVVPEPMPEAPPLVDPTELENVESPAADSDPLTAGQGHNAAPPLGQPGEGSAELPDDRPSSGGGASAP